MKCEYVRLFIHDYVDGYLPNAQHKLIHDHLLNCRHCANEVLEKQSLNRSLKNLTVPRQVDSIGEEVLLRTANFYEHKSKNRFFNLTYMALAASVFFATATGFLLYQLPKQASMTEKIEDTVATIKKEHLNLVFNSPKSLENVVFTVILPDDVELIGHPGKRKVVWSSQLQAGQNLLSLPIIADVQSEGTVVTIINYENNSKTFEVKLKNKKLLT